MDAAQVIAAAQQKAQEHGYTVSEYRAHAVCEANTWTVDFSSNREKPRPGDFFTVFIDDRTGAVVRFVTGK
jgi:hypothetical protein